MKLVLLPAAAILLIVVLMALIGACLPREHVATRAANFRQSPEKLFAVVRDFAALPTWRPDVKSAELPPPQDGVVRYREVTRHGSITYRVQEERVGARLVMEIDDDRLPYGGTWTFEFARAGEGARVRITERGFVKPALFRFLARFVFGYTTSLEQYLRALGKKFGEEVNPN